MGTLTAPANDEHEMDAKLIVLVEKARSREIPLPSTQFIIGRGPACHLRPRSRLVSKFHCAVARQAGYSAVRDLNSRNGTYVNGKRVAGTVRVRDSDVLTVGPLQFRFAITAGAMGSPVQKIHEADVRWLLKGPEENGCETDFDADTTVVEVPPHLVDLEPTDASSAQGTAAETPAPQRLSLNDQELKAGRYLREYLQPRQVEARR